MSSTTRTEDVKRKSPRIAARKKRVVMAAGRKREGAVDYYEGPGCRTRNRKKRKLGPIDDDDHVSDSDDNDVASSSHDDGSCSTRKEEPIGPAGSVMPEKRVLELVLDILQRRDSYELFGEPVKEEEMKQYYEQVKEAMDFGTMRAKLHEGMYTNLDQFQHDVFLITENAMQFNAKSTIFFRQARAIHELTKRVLHLLRSDPKGFESRVSKSRHAIGRPVIGTRQTRTSRSQRTAAAGNAANLAIPICSSGVNRSQSSKHRHRIRRNAPGRVEAHTRDGGSDRRSSYKPWTAFLNDSGSVLTTLCNEIQPTTQVRQHDFGYRESLMTFCKDLGPIAQKVALRKLQSLQSSEAPSSVPNLSSEPPSCSRRIPEEPFSGQPCPCPSASEQPMAIVPVSKPPIPTERSSRLTVLGLTNAKAGSQSKPSAMSALKGELGVGARARARADPLPLTVYRRSDLDLNRRATETFDLWPQLNISNTGLTNFPNGLSVDRGLSNERWVVVANARPFSFDLPYLKAKLDEMNSAGAQRLQIVTYDNNQNLTIRL